MGVSEKRKKGKERKREGKRKVKMMLTKENVIRCKMRCRQEMQVEINQIGDGKRRKISCKMISTDKRRLIRVKVQGKDRIWVVL